MTKTPYQRWQERTQDGKAMAAGWTSKRHTPPRMAQYEVRGARWCYLTWAYGSWWHQSVGNDSEGSSGSWHRVNGSYDWRDSGGGYCEVGFGSVIHQAAEAGNEEAKAEIARIVDERKRCTCCRSGYESHQCPVHSR